MRSLKILLAALALAALGALALWACGPFFPPWLLTNEEGILDAPSTWLREALQPLMPAGKPAFPAVTGSGEPAARTAQLGEEGLQEALAALPASRREPLVAKYREFRAALGRYASSPPPRDASGLAVPPGLPGEFDDYLRGALAYHEGRLAEARTAWETLLALPAAERRHRSTWAAFMLGKASLEDPPTAVRWFERTREIAGQGFPDPLGLAQESLGWQARAEMGRQRFDEALKLYLRQQQAGDPTALQSIRLACARALDDPRSLQEVARSSELRPVFTSWVLSVWSRVGEDEPPPESPDLPPYYLPEPYGKLDPAPARKWLAAVQAAGVTAADGADLLAWAAYRAGDFPAAEAWVRRAPGDAPMALWIHAKLLLRAGKLAEAEPLLARASAALPAGPDPREDLWAAYDSYVQPALRPRAAGELAAVRLARKDYARALDGLLRGGWWTDAAYVAEQVLTVDELRAYVDRTWPAALAARYDPDALHRSDDPNAWQLLFAGIAPPPETRIAYDLRYLLGRRLVRAGRLAEARDYLPEQHRPALDDLVNSLARGKDGKRPAAERSEALFRAACLTRYQGMELLGSEIEPDWLMYDGAYALAPFGGMRDGQPRHLVLGATADERQRAARQLAAPAKRFHYRYQGMALAREAARLLPAGSEERARRLATAGNWVEGIDPQGARPLYDDIQSCCVATETARRSRKVEAITNVPDACPADTRPKAEAQEGN